MYYFIWGRSGICKLDIFTYIYLRSLKLIWLASWPQRDQLRKSLRSTNLSDLKFKITKVQNIQFVSPVSSVK